MQGILLDRVASVWRKSALVDGYADTEVFVAIPCAVVPVSRLDMTQPFAYESTHLLWVPHWLPLRKEDQLRLGRQLPDPQGDIRQFIYTVNGRREFRMGVPQRAYYARELD